MEELLKISGMTKKDFEVQAIFHQYALEKIATASRNNTRFVHYTNADTAMKLFKNEEVWLRKSTNMNDFMEVEHGFDCLKHSYRQHNDNVKKLFDGMFQGICKRIEEHINSWFPKFRLETYLACVSEHDDSPNRNEDQMGRLSMWRAYGGVSGVAIVMNGGVFHTPITSDALKAYVSPVAYLHIDGFEQEFLRLLMNIQASRDIIVAMGEEEFFARICQSFRFAILSTKHPGFVEEREWRIIYNPAVDRSEVIQESIESIGGIPQKVCKLPLKDRSELGINGITLPSLINRVIIGPTLYPFDVAEALTVLLEKAGVENAAAKVFVSDIPLRQMR